MKGVNLYFLNFRKEELDNFKLIEKILHGDELKGIKRLNAMVLFEVLSVMFLKESKDMQLINKLSVLKLNSTWSFLKSNGFSKYIMFIFVVDENSRVIINFLLTILISLSLEKKRLMVFKKILEKAKKNKAIQECIRPQVSITRSEIWPVLYKLLINYLNIFGLLNNNKVVKEPVAGSYVKKLHLKENTMKKIKTKGKIISLKWVVYVWENFLLKLRANLIHRGKRSKKLYNSYFKSIKKTLRSIKDFVYLLAFFIPKIGLNTINVGKRKAINVLRYKSLKKQLQLLMKWFLLNVKGKGRTRGVDVKSLEDLEVIIGRAFDLKEEYSKDLRLNSSRKTSKRNKLVSETMTTWERKQKDKAMSLKYLGKSAVYQKLNIHDGFVSDLQRKIKIKKNEKTK